MIAKIDKPMGWNDRKLLSASWQTEL